MKHLLLPLCLLLALPITLAGARSAYVPGPEVNRFWQRHESLCGQPVSSERLGHGHFSQAFQTCVIAGNVGIVRSPTPTPSPSPTPLPTSTPAPPPTPSPTPGPSDGVHYLLGLINQERTSHGYAPLTLDSVLSNGDGSCVGAIRHAQKMAASGTIWHEDPSDPSDVYSFPNDACGYGSRFFTVGQNVGVANGGGERGDIDTIHKSMLEEDWSPGCTSNHHCNIDQPDFTDVGIAVVPAPYQGQAGHYLVETFGGPYPTSGMLHLLGQVIGHCVAGPDHGSARLLAPHIAPE